MKKKILMTIVVATLTLAMVACGTAQTSNNTTSTPEPTKEVEVTTTPTATNTPVAEPTAEPTVEPVATDAPTPEPTTTPEPTATLEPTVTPEPTDVPEVVEPTKAPEPTATPKPTATPTDNVKSFPCTVTKSEYDIGFGDYREITRTFDTFSELTEFLYDKMNNEMVWSYSDAEEYIAALDGTYIEVKEVKVDVKGDEDLEEMFATKHALNVVYDADRNEVAAVPVGYYHIILVERATGESSDVMGHKFVLEEVENSGTYHEETYSNLSYGMYIVNGPEITPVPTATPKPTEAPKPTKAPVVESKDFKTVLRELFVLFSYDERKAYIDKLDKSAYKVGTIDVDDFFTEGNLDKHFTGDMYSFGGERYDGYRTGANCTYKLITLEDLSTGEAHVWGVEFDVTNGSDTKTDVMIMENVIIYYNQWEYAEEYGTIMNWPTLKYYSDLFNPADYLE